MKEQQDKVTLKDLWQIMKKILKNPLLTPERNEIEIGWEDLKKRLDVNEKRDFSNPY